MYSAYVLSNSKFAFPPSVQYSACIVALMSFYKELFNFSRDEVSDSVARINGPIVATVIITTAI
jgi:hypothetical protein